MTAYQIKNELEELIYTAISSIRESRNLLEEALTATDGQQIGMSESFVRQLLAEKDRQIEQLTRIIQESLNK